MTRNLRDNDNKSATELKSHLEEMKKANEKLVTDEELEKIKAEIEMMKTNSDKLFKAIALLLIPKNPCQKYLGLLLKTTFHSFWIA